MRRVRVAAALIGATAALLVSACSFVGDERAARGPAEIDAATSTTSSTSTSSTMPPTSVPGGSAGSSGFGSFGEVQESDPVQFPPIFEPPLEIPLVFPRTPEFCGAGARVVEMSEELFNAETMDYMTLLSWKFAYSYQLRRVVALAPDEMETQAEFVLQAIYEQRGRIDSAQSLDELRTVLGDVAASTPGLEDAMREMFSWCGDTKTNPVPRV